MSADVHSRFRLTSPEPLESAVLQWVLKALSHHPLVARAWRMNTGGAYLAGGKGRTQFVQFGFKGSPDIYGFLRDGRALFVEVKRPSGKTTPEQDAFLATAKLHGCVAFVARGVDCVMRELAAA